MIAAAIETESNAAAHRTCAAESSRCTVARLQNGQCAAWDTFVKNHEFGSIFHTIAWRDTVKQTFGHEDIYLLAERDGVIVGVLPMFLVNSRFAGRLLMSVPCAVEGGVLAVDGEAADALFNEAKRIATERNCAAIDLRSERAAFPSIPIVDRYVGFRRELPDSADDVLGWLPRKARAAARNGRHKFRLSISYGDEHLREVWRLYTISMRRLASLNYPYRFFETLVKRTPGSHWVSLVRWNGKPVAGLVTLLFKDRVVPYFLGTTSEAKRCSAANFIYLDSMERGVAAGYRIFDFGRSRRDNTGSFDFKRFQGFEPRPLQYQCHVLPGHRAPNLSPENPRYGLARRIWPHLPLSLTRALGARLSAHIPG
ncbi:MAG: FemAB family PEP-CTERM system-associated protein [Planctomycetes bacterium]|nr:FemAB family PEP-CTERM system-associated protein [Planctomycetota bacterium]